MQIEEIKNNIRNSVIEFSLLSTLHKHPSRLDEIVSLLKSHQFLHNEMQGLLLIQNLLDHKLLDFEWLQQEGQIPTKIYRITEDGEKAYFELKSCWNEINAIINPINTENSTHL